MREMIEKFKDGSQTAIIHKDKKYSYAELYLKIKETLNFIKNEIKSGEVVAILSDYSFESVALFFALYENKNIIAPIISNAQEEINLKLKESFCDKAIEICGRGFNVKELNPSGTHQILSNLKKA